MNFIRKSGLDRPTNVQQFFFSPASLFYHPSPPLAMSSLVPKDGKSTETSVTCVTEMEGDLFDAPDNAVLIR